MAGEEIFYLILILGGLKNDEKIYSKILFNAKAAEE